MTAAQVREERLRMALERVQLVLGKMSTAEDLHDVLKVLYWVAGESGGEREPGLLLSPDSAGRAGGDGGRHGQYD